MALTDEDALKQDDELYERYGEPLEAEHWSRFIAIYPDGRVVLGEEDEHMDDVFFRAYDELGSGFHLFRIGSRSVGRIRWRGS